jgi:hypothetical protein
MKRDSELPDFLTPLAIDRAHGIHKIVGGKARDHPFGLINIIGNIYKRASDGSLRCGSFGGSPLPVSMYIFYYRAGG